MASPEAGRGNCLPYVLAPPSLSKKDKYRDIKKKKDMSVDIKSNILEKIRISGKFALQVDESTDISEHALFPRGEGNDSSKPAQLGIRKFNCFGSTNEI